MVSSRMPSMIERSPRAPVLRSMALRAMALNASSASVRSIDSISNRRWYCFTGAFLGELEGGLVEILKRGNDRQMAHELGNETIFQEVLRFDLAEDFARRAILRRKNIGAEADRGQPPARRDDLLKPIEGAASHEQDVRGVDLHELLLWMLASTLRRH